ncbi:MAG: phage tail tape measure protein [Aestuariivirga sp.]
MNDQSLNLGGGELKAQMEDLNRLADSFSNRLVNGFASALIHGKNLSDVMKGMMLSLSQTALSAALKPLGNLVGDMIGKLFANADGNVLQGGRVMPFADGGIVNSPVLFPMQGGTGLMGEAGPEAIMPLARGADGKLGVKGGGTAPNITINISTPDVQSFKASQSQIAAMMSQALMRGQRNR